MVGLSAAPVIMLLVLLGEGIKDYDNAIMGIKFMFVADWSKLWTIKIWRDAIN